MKRVVAYLSITRPPNGLMMFLGVLAGVALSDSKTVEMSNLVYSFITAYALSGSSMILNDYFDREIDKINAPDRPIPAGVISPSHALVYSSTLGLVGLLSSGLISVPCMLIAAASYVAAIIYNMSLKKTGLLGNFVVSLTVAAPFLFGATMSDGYISSRMIVFVVPVLLCNTGREVIKGISDVEGDSLKNVRSLARSKGEKYAAVVGSFLYISAIIVSPLPYLFGYVSVLYIPLVLTADAGLAYSAYILLKNTSRDTAIRVKNQTLVWMFVALLAYILGGAL